MSNSDDFVAAFMKMKQQCEAERMKAFYEALSPEAREAVTGFANKPKWSSLEEMNRDLARRREAEKNKPKPKPKPVDPEYRRREIQYELDIIRGVVPTPKGYKIDPTKIKALKQELKDLESK